MVAEKFRVGLIGAGAIAEAHVPALCAAGLVVSAVASRRGSERSRGFAERHSIPRVFEDWRELLAARSAWDGLVIATATGATADVLDGALGAEAAILVEKPVAWSSARLKKLLEKPHDRVIVGYNRRFYEPVQRARRECREGPPVVAHLELPASASGPSPGDPTGGHLREFFEGDSVHGLDLARYVMGDLKVESVVRHTSDTAESAGFAGVLSTARGDAVALTANWGAPSNYALTLSRPGFRYELLPFEIGTLYHGMQVEPPAQDYPVRRYVPIAVERISLSEDDRREKPGFLAQARALRSMIEGHPRPEAGAGLEDAAAVTTLCERLTGTTLGDSNPRSS